MVKEHRKIYTSRMLYRHRFSFQASLNWNPRISSSSSKVKVISMSNSPSGCSWISDGSGTSGCLILMAFNSANFDLGMSSSLQSSRATYVPFTLEAETMQVEKRMEKWQTHAKSNENMNPWTNPRGVCQSYGVSAGSQHQPRFKSTWQLFDPPKCCHDFFGLRRPEKGWQNGKTYGKMLRSESS